MVALINDRRLQRGLAPLGFLNPALYQLQEQGHDAALYDVSWAGGWGCRRAGAPVPGVLERLGVGGEVWVSCSRGCAWGRGGPTTSCGGVGAEG